MYIAMPLQQKQHELFAIFPARLSLLCLSNIAIQKYVQFSFLPQVF